MADAGLPGPHGDLFDRLAGRLDVDAAAAFDAHLVTCAACRRDHDELAPVARLVADAAPPVVVPPDLKERVLSAVEEDAVTPIAGHRRARPSRSRRGLAVLGIAAAVLVAVALAGVLGGTERPVAAEIALVAPDGGPARGTALVRATPEGREIELEVVGLAPSAPGTHYECWFVGDGDTLERPNRVSAGTFTVGADGRATLRMSTAADPARFPRMGVTLEPDDGNPRRTGDKVLVSAP